MRVSLRARVFSFAIAVTVVAAAAMRADEGFWPFSAVPAAKIKQAYGVDLSDGWLEHLRLASVRFQGASGSFVSADGLVLTNHHVGLSTIAKLSSAERDLVREGFYARTRADELKAPDLELNVLQGIEDVTARVIGAAAPGLSQAEAFTARQAAIAAIEKESTDATGLRSDVVMLYQGGQYHLYRYKRYTDVRLVFAPESDIAFFGGDPDNFTYPRYNLDVTLFRVYENDKPAKVEHYLPWSAHGAKDGELVFTSGHPGGTQRLYTVRHLQYLRDVSLPFTLEILERRHANLLRYGARGEEAARQVKQENFGIENSLKSIRGQLEGLRDQGLMGKKEAAEQALRAAVAADTKAQAEFGAAWDMVAASRAALPEFSVPYALVETGLGFDTRLFTFARAIVRYSEESLEPDTDRLPEYTEARRASFERQLFSPAPIYPDAEEAKLADSLGLLREKLGDAHPVVRRALDGKAPAARAADLVAGTTLRDVAARKALVAAGRAGVEASTDPLVVLARAVDAEARALRKQYEDRVASVDRDAYARIARAVFATHGTDAYPDGTSTLRLSFGQVRGYLEQGAPVPPFTDMAGLYARSNRFGGKPPYNLPARWVARKDRLDLATPFNFVSTNDIVGGNSGSPVVNVKGEIVGLAFDGNIQSLPGYFIYDGAVNRTVSVDSRALLEALRTVYDAGPLVDEILGARAAATQPTASR
jgi:hypothetical protein